MPSRYRASRPRAHVGEAAVVKQERFRLPGRGAERQHQPGADRKAPAGIGVEPRGHLDHVIRVTLQVRTLHVGFPLGGGKVEGHHARQLRATPGELGERLLDRGHQAVVRR
jgi:hypothetical protein